MVHGGLVGWPSQPNTEGLGHKPGSSVVVAGGNPDKVDEGWGLAGTSSFRSILEQGVHGITIRAPQGLAPHLGNPKRGTNLMS